MADRVIKILTAATSQAFVTLAELKTILNVPTTDTSHDAQFSMWITQYSAVIAAACNRTFAYETVRETWRGDPPPYERNRLFLSHWPIKQADLTTVEAPTGSTLASANYELEEGAGKLSLTGTWSEDIVVTYSGGYKLPDEAPEDLKALVTLLIQSAWFRFATLPSGGIRSISHRESRVMFFDPTALAKLHGAGPLSQAADAFKPFLSAYIRIEV